ncbi:MAG: hypothetical protein Fur009_2130 [Candidatus Microgenomates bacterium]
MFNPERQLSQFISSKVYKFLRNPVIFSNPFLRKLNEPPYAFMLANFFPFLFSTSEVNNFNPNYSIKKREDGSVELPRPEVGLVFRTNQRLNINSERHMSCFFMWGFNGILDELVSESDTLKEIVLFIRSLLSDKVQLILRSPIEINILDGVENINVELMEDEEKQKYLYDPAKYNGRSGWRTEIIANDGVKKWEIMNISFLDYNGIRLLNAGGSLERLMAFIEDVSTVYNTSIYPLDQIKKYLSQHQTIDEKNIYQILNLLRFYITVSLFSENNKLQDNQKKFIKEMSNHSLKLLIEKLFNLDINKFNDFYNLFFESLGYFYSFENYNDDQFLILFNKLIRNIQRAYLRFLKEKKIYLPESELEEWSSLRIFFNGKLYKVTTGSFMYHHNQDNQDDLILFLVKEKNNSGEGFVLKTFGGKIRVDDENIRHGFKREISEELFELRTINGRFVDENPIFDQLKEKYSQNDKEILRLKKLLTSIGLLEPNSNVIIIIGEKSINVVFPYKLESDLNARKIVKLFLNRDKDDLALIIRTFVAEQGLLNVSWLNKI